MTSAGSGEARLTEAEFNAHGEIAGRMPWDQKVFTEAEIGRILADRAPELGRLYDRLMQVTEHRDVRKYGEEHTPFSNGARRMAVAVRAEFEALFSDFRAKAEGTTETPDAPRCPSCGSGAFLIDRPESDTWECTVCGAEGNGSPPAAPDAGGETTVEWGVRYEIPDPEPLHSATRTQKVASESDARAAVANGAPIRATNRRVVSRWVTDWQEVPADE